MGDDPAAGQQWFIEHFEQPESEFNRVREPGITEFHGNLLIITVREQRKPGVVERCTELVVAEHRRLTVRIFRWFWRVERWERRVLRKWRKCSFVWQRRQLRGEQFAIE